MAYKILSLDGGGAWAMIQARVLQDIYGDVPGHEILRQFDMAIANSGGALVLACLCNNMTPSVINRIFNTEDDRKKVFSKLNFFEKLNPKEWFAALRGVTGIGPKYSAKRKYDGLRELFIKNQKVEGYNGVIFDTNLTDLPAIIQKPSLQLLFVGYDYFRQRVNFFRSNLASHTDVYSRGKQFNISLGYAIHASSNAPVNYFDAPATVNVHAVLRNYSRTTWYWDGAVSGFNNPVLAGVTEALTNNTQGLPLSSFRVLSIGTGTSNFAVITDYAGSENPEWKQIAQANRNNPLAVTDASFKFFNDVKEMATSILADPPDSATFIACAMLDATLNQNKIKLVRINPHLQPQLNQATSMYVVPAAYTGQNENFTALVKMDMDAVENSQASLISELCDKFITTSADAVPNQLIRGTQSGEYLGHPTYAEAKKRWAELNQPGGN